MLTWHEGSTLLSSAAITRRLFSLWAFEWCHCGLILLGRLGGRGLSPVLSGGRWAASDPAGVRIEELTVLYSARLLLTTMSCLAVWGLGE